MSSAFERATERVYDALTGPKPDTVEEIIAAREEVLSRYGPLFTPERAQEEDTVEGLIIVHEASDRLRYAVGETPDVDLQLYDVNFHLRPETSDV